MQLASDPEGRGSRRAAGAKGNFDDDHDDRCADYDYEYEYEYEQERDLNRSPVRDDR